MKIINLTPHIVNIEGMEEIKSSGIARCKEVVKVIGKINNIDIIHKTFGEVYDLPEENKDSIIIVSLPVAQAVLGKRKDCFVPGEIIRDDSGKIR